MHYVLIKELSVNDKDINSTDIFHSPRQNCTYWYVEAWCQIWQKHHDLTQKNARLDTKLTQYIAVATEIVKHFHPFKSLSPFSTYILFKEHNPRLRVNDCLTHVLTKPFVLIPQSHRPNRHETDLKPTKIIKFGERSVYSRYWFGFVSVYVREEIFQTCFKDLSRQIVSCLSVICRRGVGSVGERSGTCRS